MGLTILINWLNWIDFVLFSNCSIMSSHFKPWQVPDVSVCTCVVLFQADHEFFDYIFNLLLFCVLEPENDGRNQKSQRVFKQRYSCVWFSEFGFKDKHAYDDVNSDQKSLECIILPSFFKQMASIYVTRHVNRKVSQKLNGKRNIGTTVQQHVFAKDTLSKQHKWNL